MARDQLIAIRRGPATGAGSWNAVNPILGDGEFGFEKDTRKVKVGDGVTAWNSLPYIGVGASDSSTTSVNLTGGAAGSLPWQSAAGTTTFLAIGAKGKVLQVDPTSGLPAWNLPKLTDFAASNSAALLALITDATGTGTAVFSTSPTLTTPKISAGGSVHVQASGSNTTTFVAAAGAASYTLTFPARTDTVVTQSDLVPYFQQDGTGSYLALGNRGIQFNGNVNLAMPATSGTLALTTVVNGYVKADGSVAFTGDTQHGGKSIYGVGNLTLTGTLDTGLGSGVVHSDTNGVLSSGKVVLTSEVTGSLPVANGGTGGTDVNSARQGLRLYVQSAQPSSANITGYSPQVGDLWLW
jgi:hypothetical protein